MFNKSPIFKAAHAAASYERKMFMPKGKEAYAVTFARMLKAQWQLARLNQPVPAVAVIKAPKTPKLEALKFEHYRRDLSNKHYFGSKSYQEAANQIREIENQLAA